jgi:hypothetical protein
MVAEYLQPTDDSKEERVVVLEGRKMTRAGMEHGRLVADYIGDMPYQD